MIAKIFTDHPASVDETYFEHLLFATKFAATLMVAAGAALVHALIPCLCEKTASKTVAKLYAKTHNRGA
ncbi:DUF6356 family protein [Amylibacter sp. IMCC11727]|uniref:DUF6356 family protein n=1 Tax=Amylibacter sp. IMCC11727 TaxID=3039851 RepID=UPI00244E1262|nr:DUF6356 family protein [Amylibacter sp. IMCC11727]WGI22352.1 DUF6356 family protein [Amylibacter sp. IMCC11727]